MDQSQSYGGGLYLIIWNESRGSISNSTFKECKAYDGGGVYTDISTGAKLTIDGQCQFIDCSADRGGGLYAKIYNFSCQLILQDCLFRGCQARYGGGGGIYIDSFSQSVSQVNKVKFENCSSEKDGGGGI
ncbi:MAG: hypothetical protein EZS28_009187 [Streblomastix strix]|uniref:Right handed beta helix domain-containing protein n=1 Tax=Streblomastix strix TaxID=222440 RepID=A0A5J4WJT8_9EUKA|nr:MAG: hypothetical protein EZS28_009187 [Streblomastix strix]